MTENNMTKLMEQCEVHPAIWLYGIIVVSDAILTIFISRKAILAERKR